MNRSLPYLWLLGLVLSSPTSAVSLVAADEAPPAADDGLGAALFLHNWARPESWTRPEELGNGGDGLGPVFNAVSCVACHSLAGTGGAGANEHNVELLSIAIPSRLRPQAAPGVLERARALHPLLSPGNPSVMLHQFGFGSADETLEYDCWRSEIVRLTEADGRLPVGEDLDMAAGCGPRVSVQVSQRNTPALWGAGELERLRRGPGDRLREQIAVAQALRLRGISGRVPRTSQGRAGWFGWRGHVEHLPEFVLSACSNELGLSVNNHPQPVSPLAADKPAGTHSQRNLDLTNAQVIALTRFVEGLPRPVQRLPADPVARDRVQTGQQVFASTGCADCHVPDLAFVTGIYSDLLLHEMGESLSDPVSAFPEIPPPRRSRRSGTYSGGSSPSEGESLLVRTRLTHEWRTPPLWGVADSPPYLHDGRAETLEEAIQGHDGEARASADRYRDLTEADRSSLLAFLGTLRAP